MWYWCRKAIDGSVGASPAYGDNYWDIPFHKRGFSHNRDVVSALFEESSLILTAYILVEVICSISPFQGLLQGLDETE
jgi:hypothetical protein